MVTMARENLHFFGPCILFSNDPLPRSTSINLRINRNGNTIFEKSICIDQIKRKLTDIVGYLYRECSFPNGSLLMTGTGIIPPSDFSLEIADEIIISIDGIGKLINRVG